MVEIRILEAGDEAALEAFLRPRLDSSLFLANNLRKAGFADRGRRNEGTYAAAFSNRKIVAVIGHFWNQVLLFQAPDHLEALLSAAVAASGRKVGGLIGPYEQITSAKRILGLGEGDLQMDDQEGLYSLAIADLASPEILTSGEVKGRRGRPEDVDLLTEWRIAYSLEALGAEDSPALHKQSRESIEFIVSAGVTWVLESHGELVANTSFNATLPEAVQVGGVWTPPELRGKGYGRAVVAASLLDARAESVEKAILFTGDKNIPAIRAYKALGFRRIGDFRLLLLREPLKV
jgi:RimJ/RimL family protein N-acetyltransferase